MKLIIWGLIAVSALSSDASAQSLRVQDDFAVWKSFLLTTYGQNCQERKEKASERISCRFVLKPGKPRDFIRLQAEVVDTGNDPRERRQISIMITAGLFGDDYARSKYLEFAKLIALPAGGVLADKLPSPERVVAFCKSRPEAEKDNGCSLNELEKAGARSGLFIMSDADGFFVSVLEERQ